MTEQFFAWISDKPKPRVLLMDNHSSHFDFNTFRVALDNDIHIVGLPPHASHLYQPLDLATFKDMKIDWRKILQLYLRANRLEKVTKTIFPLLLKNLWQKLRPNYLVSGFRAAGLCPFNPDKIDRRKFLPSVTVTKVPTIRVEVQGASTAAEGPSASSAPSSSGLPVVSVRIQKPTPKTAMRISIEKCILGPQQAATGSGSKKRSKLQHGQVHTEDSAMKALQEREKSRLQKSGTSKRPPVTSAPTPSKKVRESTPPPQPQVGEDEDEDMMETKCMICFTDKDPPTKSRRINWNRCLKCKRWYHEWCQKNKKIFCPFCPSVNA